MERKSLIPKNKVLVTCVLNPFDPLAEGSRVSKLFDTGLPIRAMMSDIIAIDQDAYEIALSIDGALLNSEDRFDLCPSPGTSIVFAAAPRGGGGNGGSNPLRTILGLVVAIVATVVAVYTEGLFAPEAGEAWAWALGGLAGAAVGMVGNVVINALCPINPDTSNSAGANSDGSKSSTYSWDNQTNLATEGSAFPILFSTVRVVPPLIGKYVELVGSSQYLNLLFAVADHALDSISGIRINDNSIDNYSGVITETRLGANNQAACQYFNNTRLDISVGAKLAYGAWTTRRTYGNTVQGFGIGIVCPRGLYYANDQGGLSNESVNVAIEYRKVGDTDWTRLSSYITVSTPTSSYRWSGGYYSGEGLSTIWNEVEAGSTNPGDHLEGDRYGLLETIWIGTPLGDMVPTQRPMYEWHWIYAGVINVVTTPLADYVTISDASNSAVRRIFYRDNLSAGQYDVRATLYDSPPSSNRDINDVYFEYLEEAVYDDFTYPGTSLLAVRALATNQLSGGMPKIDCLASRLTVPVWTGSSYEDKAATNPAWACYHLLHSSYIGNIPHDQIVYADFLTWATWCDSKGYTINIYLDQFYNMRQALDLISVQGRATVVQMGSKWTCLVDKPESLPVQRFLFSMANMVKDTFAEAFLSMDDRATSIEVTYFDADLDYSRQTVTIQTDEDISTTDDVKPTPIILYGCTDRQQAIQYGKYLLNCNRYLTLTASWDADIDAIACVPGQVVEVCHDVPQWGFSGRIVAATENTITLDQSVTIAAGKTYQITVQHIDDDSREWLTVSNSPGTYTVLTLTTSFVKIPAQYAQYAFGEINQISKLFRVLKISRSQDFRYKLSALEYVPEVYDDYAEIPVPANISELDIRDLSIHETWELGTDGAGQSVINISWRGVAINGWNIYYRPLGGNWINAGWSAINNFKIYGLIPGLSYTVCVSKSTSDKGLSTSITPQGKNAVPSDVENFTAYQSSDAIILNWDHIPDIDLWGYEIRIGGTSWETATPIIDGEQKNTASYPPPVAGTYEFRIKAIDNSGLYSATASSVSITTTLSLANIVKDVDELTKSPQANGTYTNMILCPTDSVIALISGLTDTDEPTFTDTTPLLTDYAGEPDLYGEYETVVYDLGAINDFTLRYDVAASSQFLSFTDLTISARTDQTYPNDTDVAITSNATYEIYYRTSSNNITWTDYQLFKGQVDCHARYYQIKVRCDIDSYNTSFKFSKIRTIADVPDVDYKINDQAISSGGTTITLASLGINIFIEYQVGVTVLGTSALYPVVDKASNQFTVHLFNSAGAGSSGNTDIQLRGY
jgi:hypothetical protein